MGTCECWAHLNEKDPRAELWQQILGDLKIPIKGPFMHRMNGPQGEMIFLMGNVSRLTKEQQEAAIALLAAKFNVSQEKVRSDIESGLLPINAEHCIVEVCPMHMRLF
jgi:uncharacterized protein YabN with tetrapyrrole methylase and pyrophosphatase domain